MKKFRTLLSSLIIVVLASGVYANAWSNGYAFDDVFIVQNNQYVHGLGNLHKVLLGSYWPDMPELYRPLVLLSFATDWAVFGDNPSAFHVVNALLHALVAVLVFLLLRRLKASHPVAFTGAVLFAVHPVHVEAVANLVGRAEILAALFFLAACLLHLSTQFPFAVRVAGVALFYLVALGAKEIAVSLPAVLLLLDLFLERERLRPWEAVRRQDPLYLALGAVLACFLGLRLYVLGDARGSAPAPYLAGLSTGERLATAVRLWPEYARLLFWPSNLSIEWGPSLINPASWSDPLVWVGLVLGAASVVLASVAWNRERWISLAILWFALTIFPVSQIPFPIGVMTAERLLYLPSVGLVFLVPAAVRLFSGRPIAVRAAAGAAFVLVLSLGAWRTWQRNPAWRSTETAFFTLARENPASFRAAWFAANVLKDKGRSTEAIPLLERAASLNNGKHYLVNMALAGSLLAEGQTERGEGILRATISNDPKGAQAYLLLSESLIVRGEYREAVDLLHRGHARARFGLQRGNEFAHLAALAYDGLEMLDSALVQREGSIKRVGDKQYFGEWVHLARLRQKMGQPERAAVALDSARALAPPEIKPTLSLEPLPDLRAPLLARWRAAVPR